MSAIQLIYLMLWCTRINSSRRQLCYSYNNTDFPSELNSRLYKMTTVFSRHSFRPLILYSIEFSTRAYGVKIRWFQQASCVLFEVSSQGISHRQNGAIACYAYCIMCGKPGHKGKACEYLKRILPADMLIKCWPGHENPPSDDQVSR